MVAVMAMSTFAVAQTYDAYGPNSYKAQQDTDSNLPYIGSPYIGIAYTYINSNLDIPKTIYGDNYESDIQGDNLTLLLGYNINEYFAIEGRYSKTVGDLDFDFNGPGFNEGSKWGGDISNIALYLKPMYSSDIVTLYGLLGVGKVELEIDYFGEASETEFQWGLGISFDAGKDFIGNNDVTFFMDYTRFYDDEYFGMDLTVDALNFGLTYKF